MIFFLPVESGVSKALKTSVGYKLNGPRPSQSAVQSVAERENVSRSSTFSQWQTVNSIGADSPKIDGKPEKSSTYLGDAESQAGSPGTTVRHFGTTPHRGAATHHKRKR